MLIMWNSPRMKAIVLAFVLITATASSAQHERTVTKLADGVYAIEHRVAPGGFESGNTTVIIGDRQVFVVDTCFLPSAAREDIAQIRQWTNKPVTFVLNTHFHNDHNFGNRAFMDAFPGLTIIAQAETKKDMDRFGPGSADRVEQGMASLQKMLDTGKGPDGKELTTEDRKEITDALALRRPVLEELKRTEFQSATLTFEQGFSVDIGHREVQVRFLGRGNTAGDAIVYFPKERIVVAGDLVVYPIPYIYDGYPSEWVSTLEKLGQLDADTIIPGHGPVMHDKSYVYLLRDLLRSAVDQMDTALAKTGPAMFHTVNEMRGKVDLAPFRQRFAGTDKELSAAFDRMTKDLVNVVFREASLR
jgi:cyclase